MVAVPHGGAGASFGHLDRPSSQQSPSLQLVALLESWHRFVAKCCTNVTFGDAEAINCSHSERVEGASTWTIPTEHQN